MVRPAWLTLALAGPIVLLVASAISQDVLHVAFLLAAIGAVGATAMGPRLYGSKGAEAWWGFCASALFFFVSYLLRILFPSLDPRPSGEPTLADFVDTLGFLASIVSVHRLGQVRDKDKDPTTILDSLILTAGLGSVVWVGVLLPYVEKEHLSLPGRVLGVSIAVISLWLVFAAVRLIIGPGIRTMASRFLSGAAVFGMLSQAATTASPEGAIASPVLLSGGLALVFLGVGALHPSMTATTEPSARGIGKMTTKRFSAMTLAVLLAPSILLFQVSRAAKDPAFLFGVMFFWIAVSSLVLVRFGGLVRAKERVAKTERALSRGAASLVAATDRDETYDAALDALIELTDARNDAMAAVALCTDGEWFLAGSRLGVDGVHLPIGMYNALFHHLSECENEQVAQLQRIYGDAESKSAHIAMAPLRSHGQLRGGLILVSDRPWSSNLLDAMASLASDVSLAVEAVALAEALHRRRSEKRFRSLVEHSQDVIFVIDSDQTISFASPAAERLTDQPATQWSDFERLLHFGDIHKVNRLIEQTQDGTSGNQTVEFRIMTGSRTTWFEAGATDLRNNTEVNGIVFNARDISERKEAEARKRLSDARFRSLVQHSSDITVVLDDASTITYVTPAVEALGFDSSELRGTSFLSLLHPDDRTTFHESLSLLVTSRATGRRAEVRVSTNDGEWRTLDVTLTDLRHDEAVHGVVVNAHDITDRKALEEDLRHKVFHDDLTGIPNRVLFRDRVEHAVRSRRHNDTETTAVLFLDIDDFKTINDGLGHNIGDEYLKVIAFRLESFVRGGDTAARLGGDEFAVLLENLPSIEDLNNAVDRILNIIRQPIEFGGREITVSASIGVVVLDENSTGETLLRNADVAMYQAKQTGKNRASTFSDALFDTAYERLEVMADLRLALERNELSLFYQPLFSFETSELVGFEALMRWHHPTKGFISPGAFIPVAEETGLIVEIGAWALHEAFSQLSRWRTAYEVEVGMNVNVSPRQLQETRIIDDVQSALRISGADPKWITLELTESAGLDDELKRDRFRELRALGCQIAADDFGTGFASYAALQQLPFTNVKIDRSLIVGLSSNDPRAQAQVKSIIDMGHELGLQITAEGIEDTRQADLLSLLGADKAQGFLFGRPVPAGEAEELFLSLFTNGT